MRLTDLAGQERAIGTITSALRAGRLPHAYLFDGPPGVGKATAARALGLALVCRAAPGEGCGACDDCARVLRGNHPDVRFLAPETTQILIEQIQEVVLLATTRPHEASARLIVLDDADKMNIAAANALLKTLEEPAPANHVVLVTSAPDRLLPTIRSRAQRVRFIPVRSACLVDVALARGFDRAKAEAAAALAGGSVARALELAAGDEEAGLWAGVDALRKAAAARDVASLFDAAGSLGDKERKETLPKTLALLAGLCRDALVQAAGADDLVLLRERGRDVAQLAAGSGAVRRLRRALDAVVEAETALASNVNAVTALERLLLELRRVEARPAR